MKKRIWCAVSGHGFGHFSQIAPILERLAVRIPELTLHMAGSVSAVLLRKTLRMPFSLDSRPRDVGLVQRDPMTVDRAATAEALRALHGDWEHRLEEEKTALAAWSPDLVLADIPYLTIAAAADLGIPVVAVASLSWDHVLAAYFSLESAETHGWWQTMRQAYARATLALLPAPAILGDTFPVTESIPPITVRGRERRSELRQVLGLDPADRRPMVLVSLGGIPGRTAPVSALAREERFHWLLDVAVSTNPGHLHALDALSDWPFADVTASVDGMVSKPGYGTAVLTTANRIPFFYVRRYTFPDEPPICQWLERHARAVEMDRETFQSGAWYEALRELMARPVPPSIPMNGAERATEIILGRFMGGR